MRNMEWGTSNRLSIKVMPLFILFTSFLTTPRIFLTNTTIRERVHHQWTYILWNYFSIYIMSKQSSTSMMLELFTFFYCPTTWAYFFYSLFSSLFSGDHQHPLCDAVSSLFYHLLTLYLLRSADSLSSSVIIEFHFIKIIKNKYLPSYYHFKIFF